MSKSKQTKEEYVLSKLEKLLAIINELYDGVDNHLIPPHYIQVSSAIDSIRKHHSASADLLLEMNKIYKRVKVMRSVKDKFHFLEYNEAVPELCKKTYNASMALTNDKNTAWDATVKAYNDIADDDIFKLDNCDLYLRSIGLEKYDDDDLPF